MPMRVQCWRQLAAPRGNRTPVQRNGSVTVSTAAASNAAVWKRLLVESEPPASRGTYKLARCGISHKLRHLLRACLHTQNGMNMG